LEANQEEDPPMIIVYYRRITSKNPMKKKMRTRDSVSLQPNTVKNNWILWTPNKKPPWRLQLQVDHPARAFDNQIQLSTSNRYFHPSLT
jgi:hypothetical protein